MRHPLLAAWNKALADNRLRMAWPEDYRKGLEELTHQAIAAGLVSEAQAVEMFEAIDAGFQAAQEDLITQAFDDASVYTMLLDDGSVIGTVSRGTLISPPGERQEILGRITHHCDSRLAMYGHTPFVFKGYIDGLTWHRPDGRTARLVPRGRYVNGKLQPAIDDPLSFRLALDCRQIAREKGDIAGAKAWAQKIEAATFRVCPGCADSFARREDCARCAGLGFIAADDWSS